MGTAVGVDDPVFITSAVPFNESCDSDNLNVAPVANDDSIGSVAIGGTITFTVTDNDVDDNGNLDSAKVEIVQDPIDGIATVDVFGRITYTHTGTTAISDSLRYTVADTEDVISNEAIVSIDVMDPSLTNFYVSTLGDDNNLGTNRRTF